MNIERTITFNENINKPDARPMSKFIVPPAKIMHF
jgi:hypothetical protein